MESKKNIALVFDFDDTLAPDTTSQLLARYDVDQDAFWLEEFTDRIKAGYDPTVAHLSLLIDKFGINSEITELTETDLEAFGRDIQETIYPGLPDLFTDLNDIVADYRKVEIEYFVISEALDTIIEGTELMDYITGVYASQLDSNNEGVINRVKRPISFTDKTRYLFEINKGITQEEARENPYRVNERVSRENRRIPFDNIIYVGDGLTDIPCFALVDERGGRVFGVVKDSERSFRQEAIESLGVSRRAGNLHEPKYGEDNRLGSLLRLSVEGMCTGHAIETLEAI